MDSCQIIPFRAPAALKNLLRFCGIVSHHSPEETTTPVTVIRHDERLLNEKEGTTNCSLTFFRRHSVVGEAIISMSECRTSIIWVKPCECMQGAAGNTDLFPHLLHAINTKKAYLFGVSGPWLGSSSVEELCTRVVGNGAVLQCSNNCPVPS